MNRKQSRRNIVRYQQKLIKRISVPLKKRQKLKKIVI